MQFFGMRQAGRDGETARGVCDRNARCDTCAPLFAHGLRDDTTLGGRDRGFSDRFARYAEHVMMPVAHGVLWHRTSVKPLAVLNAKTRSRTRNCPSSSQSPRRGYELGEEWVPKRIPATGPCLRRPCWKLMEARGSGRMWCARRLRQIPVLLYPRVGHTVAANEQRALRR